MNIPLLKLILAHAEFARNSTIGRATSAREVLRLIAQYRLGVQMGRWQNPDRIIR